jgi:hypothetical protein
MISKRGWAYDTITDMAKIKTALGFYPKNQNNQSTWGALDFDAHSGNHQLAKDRAVKAFSLVLMYRDRYSILCASGRGYHVFVLANELRPVGEWTRLLTDVVGAIDVPVQDGQCELFPAEGTERQTVGKAIRMPGTYNPSTDSVEFIIAETIRPLLDRLKVENMSTRRSDFDFPLGLLRDRETNSYSYYTTPGTGTENTLKKKSTKISSKSLAKSRSFSSISTDREIEKILSQYPIDRRGTRYSVLMKMAGELFHKFGWDLSKAIVEEHYRRNRANIGSAPEINMREFASLWQDMIRKTVDTFSPSERTRFDELKTPPQREAFFIIRSFAHFYSGDDFPVAQVSLADRLNISQRGAGCVIEKLIELKAIKQTAKARINSRSARYHWIANQDELPIPGINMRPRVL